MSDDPKQPLSEVWSARFDDRDDEDLACDRWALKMAQRDRAMAQPIRNFDEQTYLRDAANDAKPSAK